MPEDCPRALVNRERVGEGDAALRALGVSRGFNFDGDRNYRCLTQTYSRASRIHCVRLTVVSKQLQRIPASQKYKTRVLLQHVLDVFPLRNADEVALGVPCNSCLVVCASQRDS